MSAKYDAVVRERAEQEHLTSLNRTKEVAKTFQAAEEENNQRQRLAAGWCPRFDPASGCMYYEHTATGKTSWTKPLDEAKIDTSVKEQVEIEKSLEELTGGQLNDYDDECSAVVLDS